MENKSSETKLFELKNFTITFEDKNSSDILVLIIGSAGLAFAGNKNIQEFKKTFLDVDSSLTNNCSFLWIRDKNKSWFNADDTLDLIQYLNELVKDFNHVCFLGESLGASGALFLANAINRPSKRCLCFGPQYSIKKPFINFNTNCGPPNVPEISISNYGFEGLINKSLLLFGQDSWQDVIHERMFDLRGFRTYYVKKAHHNVAARLKEIGSIDQSKSLACIASKLIDFNQHGWIESIVDALKGEIDTHPSDRSLNLS